MKLSIISDLAGPAEVINLDKRPEKWKQVESHLQTIGLVFNRFSAIDGSTLSDTDPRVVNQIGFAKPKSTWLSTVLPNKKARLGCSLSHYTVIKNAKKEHRKCVLILEDDVRFSEVASEIDRIRKIFEEAWQQLPVDCDILMLGANHMTQPSKIHSHFVRCTGAIGGHAYIVFDRYYDRLLQLFKQNFRSVGNPDGTGGIFAQDVLLRSRQADDFYYALNPLIATQAPGESDIVLDLDGAPKIVDYSSKLHHLESWLPVTQELQSLMPNSTIEEVWDLSHKGLSSCKIYKVVYSSDNIRKQGIIKLFPQRKESAFRVEVEAREELERMQLQLIQPVADISQGVHELTLDGERYFVTLQSYAEGLNFDELLKQKELQPSFYNLLGQALAELACDDKESSALVAKGLPEQDRERNYARDIFKKIPIWGTMLLEREEQLYQNLQKSSQPLYHSHEHGDPHGGNFFLNHAKITCIDLAGRHRTRGTTGIMGNELFNALHAIVLYGLRYNKTLVELKRLQMSFYIGYTSKLDEKGIRLSVETQAYYSFVWTGFLLYHASLNNAGAGWDQQRVSAALGNAILLHAKQLIEQLDYHSENLTDGLILEKYTGSFFGNQKITVLTYSPSLAPHLKLVPSKTSAAEYPHIHHVDHDSPEYIDVHQGEGVPLQRIADVQSDAMVVLNGGFYHFSHGLYNVDSHAFLKGDFVDFAKLRGHVYNKDKLPKKHFKAKQMVEAELEKARLDPVKWAARIRQLEDDLRAIVADAPREREIGWLVQEKGDTPFELARVDSLEAVQRMKGVKYAIPAKPVLIWDSIPTSLEQTSASPIAPAGVGTPGNLHHLYQKAPRTIWGQKDDGSWLFVVVDGRQDDAVGMTHDEMVMLMQKLGAVRAVNADGGGSSAMMVRRKPGAPAEFVNSILERDKERPVGNALFIFNNQFPKPGDKFLLRN